MSKLPDTNQQISHAHAALIVHVVKACTNEEARQQLQPMLQVAKQNGWALLVDTINKIINGNREQALLNGLDDEDKIIIFAILRGLQDPSTLPDPNQQADPKMAAPGIAQMIYAANRGSVEALQAVALMAEQMTNAHGDMRIIGGNMKRLVDGERNEDKLCSNLTEPGQALMLNILKELKELDNN
ncbi:MAG: hypothetical protein OEY89_15575 [Gammaproteobacteria bacterium]|nr:hypothetical protein [Gammaproteobacteria bacterium]